MSEGVSPSKNRGLRALISDRSVASTGNLASQVFSLRRQESGRSRMRFGPTRSNWVCRSYRGAPGHLCPLTPGDRFRYYADQIVCDACDQRNPQTRRRMLPRGLLQPHTICVNFLGGPRSRGTSHGARSPHCARPATQHRERGDSTPTARLSRRNARAACRLRR